MVVSLHIGNIRFGHAVHSILDTLIKLVAVALEKYRIFATAPEVLTKIKALIWRQFRF